MMDVHETYDNHFMGCVNQISMLYILNLYGAVCQLHLNKTGRKKEICRNVNKAFLLISFCFGKQSFYLRHHMIQFVIVILK